MAERGTHSGSNLWLKSRRLWIWKKGFSPFAISRRSLPPSIRTVPKAKKTAAAIARTVSTRESRS